MDDESSHRSQAADVGQRISKCSATGTAVNAARCPHGGREANSRLSLRPRPSLVRSNTSPSPSLVSRGRKCRAAFWFSQWVVVRQNEPHRARVVSPGIRSGIPPHHRQTLLIHHRPSQPQPNGANARERQHVDVPHVRRQPQRRDHNPATMIHVRHGSRTPVITQTIAGNATACGPAKGSPRAALERVQRTTESGHSNSSRDRTAYRTWSRAGRVRPADKG